MAFATARMQPVDLAEPSGRQFLEHSGSALMRGITTGVGSEADFGAAALTQLSVISTRPNRLWPIVSATGTPPPASAPQW